MEVAELVYIMAKIKDMEVAGIDTAGIRENGEYGIKHINLIPAEVWNKIRWDNNFLALSQADTDTGMAVGTELKESEKPEEEPKELTEEEKKAAMIAWADSVNVDSVKALADLQAVLVI